MLGATCMPGVRIGGGEADPGGAGARRGLPKAEPWPALRAPPFPATPSRDAAAFSFKMAISSSETPGRLVVSCLKLKGAEICRDCRFGVVTLVLRPISRCSLAAKPLRFRQPSMVIAMMEGEIGGGGGSGCRCSVSVSVSGVNVDCGCGSAEVWAYVCVWVFTKVC